MLGGLAVEAASLYRDRLRLERAARAATIAGVSWRVLMGWWYVYGGEDVVNNPPQAPTMTLRPRNRLSDLQKRVKEVLVNNLYEAGFEVGTNSATPDTSSIGRIQNLFVVWNPVTDSVSISFRYLHKQLFLPSYLPGLGQIGCPPAGCPIDVGATSTLNPANIAMVLDTSGSMACPAPTAANPNPGCACRTAPTGCSSAANVAASTLTALKSSVRDFYRYFNPFKDRIAVIPFNLGADPNPLPLNNGTIGYGATQAAYTAFTNKINNMVAFSNTNHCDGLLSAINIISGATVPSDNPTIVFFSDGAPNAGRYSFLEGPFTNQAIGNSASRLTEANPANDWYQYTLEWTTNTGSRYLGPSPLINCQTASGSSSPGCRITPVGATGSPQNTLFNLMIGGTVAAPNANPWPYPNTPNGYNDASLSQSGRSIRCGPRESAIDKFQSVLNSQQLSTTNPGVVTGGTQACLTSNLGFVLPGLRTNTDPATIDMTNPVPTDAGQVARRGGDVRFNEYQTLTGPAFYQPYDYEQLPYHCAIRAADYARITLGARVYAIGLGPRANRCAGDPYQDVSNSVSRKDVFLSRLAFDPAAEINENGYSFGSNRRQVTISGSACTGHSRIGQTINVGTASILATPNLRTLLFQKQTLQNKDPDETLNGAYFPASNREQIQQSFIQIAKQILLRQAS